MGCFRNVLFERLLSEKSGRCGIAADWRCGALPMIDRGDIRQAIDRCSNIWASLPGAGYGQFGAWALTVWLQKFKEAGGTVREIDTRAESPRLSPLWLSASSSACHGLLIINDNAITYKAQRDKNAARTGSWRTRQLLTCRCVSVMLLRSMQNTRRS